MWIFDEILPKSQSSGKSGSSSGTQDPITTTPIVISDSESIVTSTDILENIEKQPEEVTKVEENTSILIEETPESILNDIDNDKDPVSLINQVITSEKEDSEAVISFSDTKTPASPFFDMISEETPEKEVNLSNTDADTNTDSFQDTNEYIDHALVGVKTLMENLEKADAKKLAEEDEYTHQKEHFTELAIQAEEEHQKILAEKAHAEKVKAYLEQEKIENNSHENSNSNLETPLEAELSIPNDTWETPVKKEETTNSLESDITALLTEPNEQEKVKETDEIVAV